MGFVFKEGKEGKPGFLSGYKWEETNSKSVWDELIIKPTDSFYYLFGHCSKFTDVQNFDDKKWNFTPQKLVVKIARKDYTTTFKGETKQHQQSVLEKFICKYLLDSLNLELVYSGSIHLQHIPMVEMILKGELDNKPEIVQSTVDSYFEIKPLENQEELNFIKKDEFSPPEGNNNKGSYGGGSKGQTELEKLNDRMTFVLQQLKVVFPETTLENSKDVIELLSQEEKPGYIAFCAKVICEVANLSLGQTPF